VEALAESEQFTACALELAQALGDLVEAVVDEVGDVLAGGQAAVTDVEDFADLGEGESGGLGLADEGHAGDGAGGVVAVASSGACGFGWHPIGLVEAQCLGALAGGGSELADQHRCDLLLTFQRDGRRSVTVPRAGRSLMTNVTLLYFDGCPNW